MLFSFILLDPLLVYYNSNNGLMKSLTLTIVLATIYWAETMCQTLCYEFTRISSFSRDHIFLLSRYCFDSHFPNVEVKILEEVNQLLSQSVKRQSLGEGRYFMCSEQHLDYGGA